MTINEGVARLITISCSWRLVKYKRPLTHDKPEFCKQTSNSELRSKRWWHMLVNSILPQHSSAVLFLWQIWANSDIFRTQCLIMLGERIFQLLPVSRWDYDHLKAALRIQTPCPWGLFLGRYPTKVSHRRRDIDAGHCLTIMTAHGPSHRSNPGNWDDWAITKPLFTADGPKT